MFYHLIAITVPCLRALSAGGDLHGLVWVKSMSPWSVQLHVLVQLGCQAVWQRCSVLLLQPAGDQVCDGLPVVWSQSEQGLDDPSGEIRFMAGST